MGDLDLLGMEFHSPEGAQRNTGDFLVLPRAWSLRDWGGLGRLVLEDEWDFGGASSQFGFFRFLSKGYASHEKNKVLWKTLSDVSWGTSRLSRFPPDSSERQRAGAPAPHKPCGPTRLGRWTAGGLSLQQTMSGCFDFVQRDNAMPRSV